MIDYFTLKAELGQPVATSLLELAHKQHRVEILMLSRVFCDYMDMTLTHNLFN